MIFNHSIKRRAPSTKGKYLNIYLYVVKNYISKFTRYLYYDDNSISIYVYTI